MPKPTPPRQTTGTRGKPETVGFEKRWLGRFGLPLKGWKGAVESHLANLPFCDPDEGSDMLDFLFRVAPQLLANNQSEETERLAEAYGWICFSFWQCGSAFPAFPEDYADFLRNQLAKPAAKRDQTAGFIADLILGGSQEPEGRCGFNRLVVEDPVVIRESEQRVNEGGYEFYLKAREKYREYEAYLQDSPEFRKDWQALKAAFKAQVKGKGILRRSPIPERNWVRGKGAVFTTSKKRFQAAFDLFCWKYFLWGMDGDSPLLLKTSIVFTPYGTQIFIPGYLSFDAKRDLDYSKVASLHRARGIPRQGPGFSVGREELTELKKKAQRADRLARKKGLKGEARYEFVCNEIGFVDSGDYRRLRKLLSAATD